MTQTTQSQEIDTKQYIDVKRLTLENVDNVLQKLEKEAVDFEINLASYMRNPKANDEKVARLWNIGKSIWLKVKMVAQQKRKLYNAKV